MTDAPDTPTAASAEDPAFAPGVFDIFETDAAAEEDGRWFNNFFGAAIDGAVKLRSLTSQPVVQARQRLDVRYGKYMKDGVYPQEVQDQLNAELLAEAVLLDWRGAAFKDREGKPLVYSKGAAKMLLAELRHFRTRVLIRANDLDAFRREVVADATKN